MKPKLRVCILGATGAVGQRFIELLEHHPWFEVTAVAASERSAGRAYRDAVNWLGHHPIPPAVADLTVGTCVPPADSVPSDRTAHSRPFDLVFSGLDASVAGEVEAAFAAAGYPVISNAKNHRMHPDVPLLIPEVNPEHLALIEQQRWGPTDTPGSDSGSGPKGFIVTNPNCATVGLVMALKPLHDAFGVESVLVTTMQAISGAGYPGVPALDILGNIIPHIGGEEDKLETEPLKILGDLSDPQSITPAKFAVSASANRVPVVDGHLESVSVRLTGSPSPGAVAEALRNWTAPDVVRGLPSSPEKALEVFDDPSFPQPARHVGLGNGMTVSVGKIRACPVLGIKFNVLSHNTIRGAAGGAVLNAELLVEEKTVSATV
ncbi:MAG: aspartate-semialdehyde dehydrogenase [Rhodothermales bacterium]